MAVGAASRFPLAPVQGVRLGSACAGIRKPGRRDLVILELAPGSRVAARFTRNAFCAAPVTVAREHLATAAGVRHLLINTGNANAGTGERGIQDARACCDALADLVALTPQAVLPFSTGVIGEPLPTARVIAGLSQALAALDAEGWQMAAEGIMTTDTRPKGASRRVRIGTSAVTVSGIAKGAGMIRPDMATMLAFVATDATVDPALLDALLGRAVDASFNAITVDGDTSTNDACVLVATGAAGAPPIRSITDAGAMELAAALEEVCLELAQAIVRDAEGATKFVEVMVRGGLDVAECRRAAYAVAESPLVKTALFASDPNWGRILAAVGRAGVAGLDVARVAIDLDEVPIVRGGARDPAYTEADGQRVMAREEIRIVIDLGRGAASASVWTSDLSHDYVRINAEYRT
ncbi:MAG: bifunctional glutamate N-acetyltransferase/amino-acid acetyltransferase ArgJ [Pseudomonadales bacterium]|jgi:glutamate N-acetyltransferase/amino-acid N-acetyltransferase|nr:bifunctional glutamate N-acetyltransferase/amino-acid acetyltransferase ArgJ [Pseudomonadales bacterium]MCP5321542.1 bifunctional glutamate N-acetyltransferase/amino-acid acetyltransferase ArgJ [Pseudomonadales bacterium]MCP5336455.1 bifunctional glutamate N-acetyltransferase/amino-acid acetyltransferase ArgJ [Pseudomonadales bacterium]